MGDESDVLIPIEDEGGNTLIVVDVGGYLYPPSSGLLQGDFGAKALNDLEKETFYDDDIIICAYPRSGFHWTWEMVNMLIHNTNELSDIPDIGVLLDVRPKALIPEDLPRPRLFGCHMPLFLLPETLRKKRIIFVYRNPKDIACSMYNLLTGFDYLDYEGSFENFLKLFMDGRVPFDSWFRYMRSWEDFALDHTCAISYEQLKKDPAKTLQKIATYVGVEVDRDRIDTIINTCSVKNMKENKKLHPLPWKNGEQRHIHKGVVGRWKDIFSDEMNEKFDKLFQEKMKDSRLDLDFGISTQANPEEGKLESS